MWESHPDKRLVAWHKLRAECADLTLEQTLHCVNTWWAQAPTVLHYLHWDLVDDWPNPWDLLHDAVFCELAKSLGICYTLLLLDKNINDLHIAETNEGDYIVSVNDGKYILNWAVDQVLNTNSISNLKITRSMDSAMFTHKIQ